MLLSFVCIQDALRTFVIVSVLHLDLIPFYIQDALRTFVIISVLHLDLIPFYIQDVLHTFATISVLHLDLIPFYIQDVLRTFVIISVLHLDLIPFHISHFTRLGHALIASHSLFVHRRVLVVPQSGNYRDSSFWSHTQNILAGKWSLWQHLKKPKNVGKTNNKSPLCDPVTLRIGHFRIEKRTGIECVKLF